MANPYVLFIAFALTAIGAWNGLKSIILFLSERGDKFANSLAHKIISKRIEEAVQFAISADDNNIEIFGRYAKLLSEQILTVSFGVGISLISILFVSSFSLILELRIFIFLNASMWLVNALFSAMTVSLRIKAFRLAIVALRISKNGAVSDEVEESE